MPSASAATTSRSALSRAAGADKTLQWTGGGYLAVSHRPWASLLFLLPMIVLYEVGTIVFARDAATGLETRIIAFNLLNDFLGLFGASGRYLPALAVVAILLAWHLARRDSWSVRPGVLVGMLVESICWALPLLALAVLMGRFLPLAGSGGASPMALMVLSLGAGIYEELVFRLVGFAVCSFVLSDVLGVRASRTFWATLVITSVAFSLYHYLGWESPQLRSFVFRTIAGFFFGVLYLWRGFGIAAGCHAAYDVLVFSLRSADL